MGKQRLRAEIVQDMAPQSGRMRWSSTEPGSVQAGQVAFAAGRSVFTNLLSREQDGWRAAQLYGGLMPDVYRSVGALQLLRQRTERANSAAPRIRYNVIRQVIDAARAQITRAEVRPYFLSSGGEWSMQRRAKQLTKFSDGQLYKAKIRTLGPDIFLDSAIFDLGAVKVSIREGEPLVERVFPLELGVDLRDGLEGNPREMYQRHSVDKEALLEQYPDKADLIRSANLERDWFDSDEPSSVDHVSVVEVWRRATPKSKGRHIVALSSGPLLDEEWTSERFPFSILRYSKGLRGWFGTGMEWHLRGMQLEINATLRTIQNALHLGAVPRVFLEQGSKIAAQTIGNTVMEIINYRGQKPDLHPGVAFPSELVGHLSMLIQGSFDQEGVSRGAARSESRPGLSSGRAIRMDRDIGTERFSVATKAYEEWTLDVTDLLVETGREIAKKDKSFGVLVPGPRYSETLEWSKVNMDRDKYVLKAYPTNMLSEDPSERTEDVQDLLKAGMIEPAEGRRLLRFPDEDAVLSLEAAAVDDILAEVERLLDGKAYRSPEPYQALELGMAIMQKSWLKARNDGAPDDVLENVQRWVADADDLLKRMQGDAGTTPDPAAAAQALSSPTAGMGAPQGVPGAAPVSDLLPTAPPA